MRPNIAERAFEDAIVSVLVSGRPPGASGGRTGEPWPGYGEFIPGGYRLGKSEEYDRSLCLVPEDVYDFILATATSSVQRWEITLERLLTRRWRLSKGRRFV